MSSAERCAGFNDVIKILGDREYKDCAVCGDKALLVNL